MQQQQRTQAVCMDCWATGRFKQTQQGRQGIWRSTTFTVALLAHGAQLRFGRPGVDCDWRPRDPSTLSVDGTWMPLTGIETRRMQHLGAGRDGVGAMTREPLLGFRKAPG